MPRFKKITSKKERVIASPSTALGVNSAKQSNRKIATSSLDKLGTPRNDRKRASGLSVPVYSLAGRAAGILTLPKDIFGAEVNKKLLAQAVRVYSTNQRMITASTKTRGEVRGSTAKIYRQKGTGRARHGAITAPIFVGGGIVFGPKPRKVRLELPQKMKKTALFSALSSKAMDKSIVGVSGLEKATGKTKEVSQFLNKVSKMDKKLNSALIVAGGKMDNVVRAARNIPGINVLPVNLINAYEVFRHDLLVFTKDAIEKLVQLKGATK